MEKKNFDYDDLTDSLFISRKEDGERVQGSAEIGNLIIDFTNKGKIINVEISGISKFLEKMKIKSEILEELESAKLTLEQQGNAVAIWIFLQPKMQEVQAIPLATIPLARPSPLAC